MENYWQAIKYQMSYKMNVHATAGNNLHVRFKRAITQTLPSFMHAAGVLALREINSYGTVCKQHIFIVCIMQDICYGLCIIDLLI